MRLIALLAVCATAVLPLGCCILPPVLSVVSFVGDGISMATNGKTMSDNAISTLAGEDCRLFRLLKGEWICHGESKVVAVAELPPAPAEPPLTVVSPYPRPAEPIIATAEPLPAPAPMIAAVEPAPPKTPAAVPAAPSPAPAVAAAKPTRLETPSAAPAPRMAQTPAIASARPPAASRPARAAPPAQQAAVPTAPTPAAARVLRSGPPVHGEMVIQGGTNPAEAEAIAGQLKGFPAKVRPVEKDGVTVYEVVVGLSG